MRHVELSGEREIDRFESVAARVRRLASEAHVVVIEIGAGGRVGRHSAAIKQLFVVVRGDGWVAGADGERQVIGAGEAVVWERGEEHESGSDNGLTALVIETDALEL
jgi:quercetin dioxygenase-like cupin family protein